jgi:ubiquitin-protein ligase E3 D
MDGPTASATSTCDFAFAVRAIASKGYSTRYILLTNIKAKDKQTSDGKNETKDLSCPQCQAIIGLYNPADSNHRLWKSRLAVKHDVDSEYESFNTDVFLGAQMLHLVESSVSRRVVVHDGSSTGLLCWMFNPDIYYSSSRRGPTVHRAMKVFYKEIEEPLKMLDENGTSLEELALPSFEVEALRESMAKTEAILPVSARTFQEWKVGLIDRFEAQPSGFGAMDQNALNHKGERIELFKLPPGWAELYQ